MSSALVLRLTTVACLLCLTSGITFELISESPKSNECTISCTEENAQSVVTISKRVGEKLVTLALVSETADEVDTPEDNILIERTWTNKKGQINISRLTMDDCQSAIFTCLSKSVDGHGNKIESSAVIKALAVPTEGERKNEDEGEKRAAVESQIKYKDIALGNVCNNERKTERLAKDMVSTLMQDPQRLCYTDDDGNHWILFQKRVSENCDFSNDWETYKTGFGTYDDSFWLGNENIYQLTKDLNCKLRVHLKYGNGNKYNFEYDSFSVGSEETNYTLQVGGYNGVFVDSLRNHNGMAFSTKDRDNAEYSNNCAKNYNGGWWYKNCVSANLNGGWGLTDGYGIVWNGLQEDTDAVSVTFTEMKMLCEV